MKKGISICSFAEPDLSRVFALAKDAGFDGVELASYLGRESILVVPGTFGKDRPGNSQG